MIIYKLKVIYNNETYKQQYNDKIDTTNALIALLKKGYITVNAYNEISDFLAEMSETDLFNIATISPNKNIKLEMEMIDDNDDHTIDDLLRRIYYENI